MSSFVHQNHNGSDPIIFHGIKAEIKNGKKSLDISRLIHPFTCIIAGPTGCGKSTFVHELLQQKEDQIHPPPERIIWCYSEWQSLYTSLMGKVEFHQGLPEELNPKERNLVILDDLMNSVDQNVIDLFTKGSHHRNISVIHIVQNLFHQGKGHRTISLNSHYMVLFKNPRDVSQINHLATQMYPNNSQFLKDVFIDATTSPYGYLFIDLKQETQENLRLRTNILKNTQQIYVPI